ncbi:MAG: carboxypeptidase regulatory-like domain-containing protein, partial [Bacteroidota bacterium]|nr:carboxypeptidase regulatory-like domain-containing protein [Bacteroidota bacterium]
MTRNRTFVFSILTFSFLLILGFTAPGLYAQTGKISAKILDAKSGEPLFKASIQILETKQGALSKDNGIATIINVAPSEHYTVVAKYAGYEPFTIKGVKVQSDQTTKLEFKLSSKIQDTIVVAAEKLVDVTKVGIGDKLSNSDIIAIAGTKNISEVVAVTPGIVKDASNGGFSVHGSRGTDNSERINNIETTNIVNGGESISQKTTSKFAISELSIATGGLDASKGNTTGAEINATTRAGGSRFEFQLRYRTDVPAMFGSSSNGYKQMGSNDKTYELALGGPLTEDIKYFITAKGITQQFEDELANGTSFGVNGDVGLNVIDPAGNNLGQLPNAHYYSRGATANISFDLLGFHMAADAVLSSVNRQFTGWGSTYGDPAEIPAANSIDNLYTLTGNTSIGSSGILKLTAGYQAASDHIGKYDFAAGGGLFSMYKIYNAADNFSYDDNTHTITPGGDGIVDIYTPVSKQIADPHNPSNLLNLPGAGINPFTGRIEGGGIVYSTNNPYGLLNTFLTAGNVFGFTNQTRQQVQIEGQYNDQFGSHGILGGFETHFYNISNYDNLLPWDANPFRDSFTVKPLIAAVYLVDKMEFSDITFQPSLRFDIYNPGNNHVLVDPYNPIR